MIQKQPPKVFCKNGALRNFAKFTGKHLWQSFFFNKVSGLKFATLLTPSAPISQNGQTHSKSSSSNWRRIVWVCLTILWDWRLKGFKKETLAQVFSCEFCEISQNTFLTEHFWWLLLLIANFLNLTSCLTLSLRKTHICVSSDCFSLIQFLVFLLILEIETKFTKICTEFRVKQANSLWRDVLICYWAANQYSEITLILKLH